MLQSNDVIHSFWVPSLAGKQDLIPGRETDITHRCRARPASIAASAPNFAACSTRTWRSSSTVDSYGRLHQMVAAPAAARAGAARRRSRWPAIAMSPARQCSVVPQRSPGRRRAARSGPTSPISPAAARIAAGHAADERGQSLRLGRRPAVAQARHQHADHRPRAAKRAARRRRLSRDAEMTSRRLRRKSEDENGSPRAQEDRARRPEAERREARSAAGADLAPAAGSRRLARDRRPQGDRPPLHRHGAASSSRSAGVLALLMRLQLARPDNDLIGADRYNEIFTMHGSTMMFLFAVPVMEGVAVYIIPLMLGTRAIALPAAQRVQLLHVSVRRAAAVGRVRAQHRAGHRLVRLYAAVGPAILARQARRHLGADDHLHRGRRARRRGRPGRDDPQAARARA